MVRAQKEYVEKNAHLKSVEGGDKQRSSIETQNVAILKFRYHHTNISLIVRLS